MADSPLTPLDAALKTATASAPTNLTDLVAIEKALKSYSNITCRVATQAGQEQEWFWSRFSALATLHAALLVFSRTGVDVELELGLGIGGLVLGALWFTLQMKSWYYVRRSWERLSQVEILVGFRLVDGKPESQTHASDIGLAVSAVVFVLWIYIVFGS